MEKIIKNVLPLIWITAIMFSLFFAVGCTGNIENTEVIKTDTMVAPPVMDATILPVDSLPPIDSTTKQRPVPIKSNQ